MTKVITLGDTIAVNYTGRMENGEIFDSTKDRMPVKFTVGLGSLIRGFERAVIGMTVGEKKTIVIAPEDAYGPRREEMLVDLPRGNVPADVDLAIGAVVILGDRDGNTMPATIVLIEAETVRVDLNHCMAGKTLVFDIEILEID
ncbi:MAG TPA: peptidylprolyl isomerase [Syntrophales bacterium]|nr:peptidylprolyl isomerase [Syntrophales bacterium]HOX93363.1 peptidylprolyl isomerase [Syntrophales bacterium]HPI56092.1 peptidylprolyl isomerase [Syntrophales bacterium]HPN24018.1 peptidylprolyl isomerase [Syntrophales bacterium]HQM28297.1 peptidylprolyl isomerase [Syntrophales bacterium]